MAVALDSPHGAILHTGDFKFDQTPLDGRPTDLHRLAEEASGRGVPAAQRLNERRGGRVHPERANRGTRAATYRPAGAANVVAACFSSHIHRVQQIVNAARADQRVVAFLGRSMETSVAAARRLGILQVDDRDVIDIAEVADLDPGRVVVICTGSQGAVLGALAHGAAPAQVGELAEGDTVVLSSSLIPATSRRSTASDALYRTRRLPHARRPGARERPCRAGGAAPDALPRPSSVVHPGARRAAAPAASRPPQPKTSASHVTT